MNTTYADRVARRNAANKIARIAEAEGRFAEAAEAWELVASLEDRRPGNACLAYAEGKAIDCASLARRS